ncbi:hypothetical protein [uncultured Tenacibaculum sp.]|uniref:hypothetical protein n=1 Tax=uncultured Tenacibaculum sp. TaxID=174713 RepID=UPI002601675F|nr:hypothetical protein [uncultured Tenacibaculum sp.]
MTESEIKKYLDENYSLLNRDEIYEMKEFDGGLINNVINNIEKHCYGYWLLDDGFDNNYFLFYVNGGSKLTGARIKLQLSDENRNELTFNFARVVNQDYPDDVDLMDVFNRFQYSTRTLLERLSYYTYGDELIKKKGSLILENKKGAMYVPILNKKKSIKSIFSINISEECKQEGNKTYLMFNAKNNYTKIGRSIKPKIREKTLQGEEPDIEIIALWNTSKSVEKNSMICLKIKESEENGLI